MQKSPSTGSGNHCIASLPAHNDGVVQGFANGHVTIVGHSREDKDLNAPKEVHGEELCHAAIVGN